MFDLFKIYEVGGSIRDSLLGLKNKDEDFLVVFNNYQKYTAEEAFKIFEIYLKNSGYNIFLSRFDCLTIRARSPIGVVSDYVIARKDIGYKKETRTPIVELGSLKDDLMRRDFTVNAFARDASDPDSKVIDLFNGFTDLKNKTLRTPLDPMETLIDDPLRALRAVRFTIKLDFEFSDSLYMALLNPDLIELMHVVSTDRIREELTKCFKMNTWKTLEIFNKLPTKLIKEWLTRPNLWLMPTTKK